jgi:hypothetical protein
MSTSGVYVIPISLTTIIREAMLNIGKLGANEQPTAQETIDCTTKLNMLVSMWQARQDFAPGLKVWTMGHGTLFLSAQTGVYNLGPSGDNWTDAPVFNSLTTGAAAGASALVCTNTGINSGDFIGVQLDAQDLYWSTVVSLNGSTGVNIAGSLPSSAGGSNYVYSYTTKSQRPQTIETAFLRDNAGSDTPLNIGTMPDYDLLPSKMQTGYIADPTFVYYEAQLTNGVLKTDMNGAQDVTKQIHLSYLNPIQGFVNPTDNPQYPQEWYMALCWGLTKAIAPMFNMPFTKDMDENLREAVSTARESYTENTSMYFQPGIA